MLNFSKNSINDKLDFISDQIQILNNRITRLEEKFNESTKDIFNFKQNINSIGDRITHLEGSFSKEIEKLLRK